MALRRLLSSTLLKQHESYCPEVFCPEILLDMPPDGDPGCSRPTEHADLNCIVTLRPSGRRRRGLISMLAGKRHSRCERSDCACTRRPHSLRDHM